MQQGSYYPDTGRWAVLGRLSLIAATLVILFASFAPVRLLPHVLYSYHLEHFAAFYVMSLTAAAAFVRRKALKLGLYLCAFALGIEFLRLLLPAHRLSSLEDWFADGGGVMAALVPIAIGKFRSRFRPGGA